MNENQHLIDYYSNYDENGRLDRRHNSLEFLTTMRYIEKYLKPGDRIIEIGAATGRYSHSLARMGYRVDAVELVEHNIEIFKANTQPGEVISITQGNAMDLSEFEDETYDITLVLGPLYHLYNQEDKRKALGEAIRVTKTGGMIFTAHIIADSCILHTGFITKRIDINEYIERGLIDPVTFATSSTPAELFELVRKEQIDELISVFPVKRMHYVAVDGYASYVESMREALEQMDEEMFALFLKYHFATCEREDLAGTTTHSLDILMKEKPAEEPAEFAGTPEDIREVKKEIAYYNSLPYEFDGFIDIPTLSDGEIYLVCVNKRPEDKEKKHVPGYEFAICKEGEKIGELSLRIGYGGGPYNSNLYYGGQIGYNIDEPHRGHGYVGRACRLVVPVAKAHKMKKLLITTSHTNNSSMRVCEKLGARLIRIVQLPEWNDLYNEGNRYQNIYEWDIENE